MTDSLPECKRRLQVISAEYLDSLISQFQKDGLRSLALFGPRYPLSSAPDTCSDQLKNFDGVFQLVENVDDLAFRISTLNQLARLVLRSTQISDLGANAIAENLTQLTTLDLYNNEIDDVGAISIAENLTQLTTLNFGSNQIGAKGAEVIAEALTQLTTLDLGSNEIGLVGAKAIAENLTQLDTLDLRSNQIGNTVAMAIAENLTQLTTLNLRCNQISAKGAKAIAENLTQLATLDLSYNQIGHDGAQAIAENLTQLTKLRLYRNQIGDHGANSIAEKLNQLAILDLGGNEIGLHGAKAIAENLTQLTTLNLSYNLFGNDGAMAIAKHLTELTTLNLRRNHISDEGAESIAEHLTQLTTLNLSYSRIGAEGAMAIAKHLTELTTLDLSQNQIGDEGAKAIAENRLLPMLLNLSDTEITDLRPFKNQIQNGMRIKSENDGEDGILLNNCPLKHPTIEIVQQGHDAVLNYFAELDSQGEDYIYEAKVLILGPGGSGKTSLQRRLYEPERALPREDETTKGIDVFRHEFQTAEGNNFRVNVWDFGGQQIYHSTHQFFLTKNSLYILVDDTRNDDTSVNDDGFKYWLEVVEALSQKSPILIFQNEKGGRSKAIDEPGIRTRFTNFCETHRGNLESVNSADELRQAIEYHVQRLPHIGEAVPAKWVTVRAALEEKSKQRPFISQAEYFAIYDKILESNREKALHLSRYFHDLGVFLHFQDDLALQKTVILQDRWATEAVFKILDDETVKNNLGRFKLDDCARRWESSEYADMHLELLALMEKFELCYLLADTEPKTWLAPKLMGPSRPNCFENWEAQSDLVLTYRYEFLPKGLVSRLMVRMNRFVKTPGMSWTNGALFDYDDSELLVEATARGNEIVLRAKGPERKALMSVIAMDLDALNASFQGLESKVGKWVPCTCTRCSSTTAPELFEQKRLLQRRNDNKLTIECPLSYEDVGVLDLLDGLKLDQLPKWAEKKPDPRNHDKGPEPSFVSPVPATKEKTIKIFLASSSELRSDRDEFDLYFRQQNDRLRKQGIYLEVVRWENFLDAMSESRLQDEYNKEIRACDIFISLFKTKTGKYTEEEFDVAHDEFTSGGTPLIYTFFKNAEISLAKANQKDLMSLWAFKEKLDGLGHFHTNYENIDHLKRQFRDQLDKILDKRLI